MPKALKHKPKRLTFVESQYYDAYNTICQSRTHYGEGYPNPLQLSEILAYLGIIELTNIYLRIRYTAVVKKMDRAYLDWWFNKHKT